MRHGIGKFVGRLTGRLIGTALVLSCSPAAQAASITSLSPQGEVAQVRQVVVKFSDAVVRMGDPRLPDPVQLRCEGKAPAGTGRWSNDRVWLFDFREPLPPGQRCTVTAIEGWAPLDGALTGTRQFGFGSGGPAVVSVQPWPGSVIEEDQHFILRLSGPAVEASVAQNAACQIEGVGERLPVRVVGGEARAALIKLRRLEAQAAQTLVLACQRPAPSSAKLRLVWGAGIASQANPQVRSRDTQTFDFEVRAPFSAEFGCERERAGAPCVPVRPLTLGFSAPISRALAEQVRLRSVAEPGTALAPLFDKDDKASEFSSLRFPVPLAENAKYTLVLPPGIVDAAGRALANAASFPLGVATGSAPPIAKFAAAPFGVIELKGEPEGPPLLPVTLRHVQGDLRTAAPGGQVRVLRVQGDAEILAWYARLRRLHETEAPARDLGLPEKDWTTLEEQVDGQGRKTMQRIERLVPTREVGLLTTASGAKRLDLPALQGGDPRPFEVIGIPLPEPGFHVVEIESKRLGSALLAKPAPMFVRTGVLVTNLGVHFKQGRENSAVWVTTLDRGRPVAGAEVAVYDCDGRSLWNGRTDANGLARVAKALEVASESCIAQDGLFVTARAAGDTAFVFGGWQQGIEPWRFNHPIATGIEPDARAHTVLDRTLLRAGETVSMKHFFRLETTAGLAPPASDDLPTRLKLVHRGSGQEFVQPLTWAPGARHALSTWAIPRGVRLGGYDVVLERESVREQRQRSWVSGSFQVEEFRVPLVDARLSGPAALPVAPTSLPLDVQLTHLSGGGVVKAPLQVSALLRSRVAAFAGFEDYSFAPPKAARSDDDGPADDSRLVADKLPASTDAQGAARIELKDLPAITRPSQLQAEVTFTDPNGEVQTVASNFALWPSAVVVGIQAGSWASQRGSVSFKTLALDTAGKPLKGQALEVRGRLAQTISTRKRLVGGFYAYDNRTEYEDLGVLCQGTSDAQGRLDCSATLKRAGEVELIVQARDAAGRMAQAAASVWITGQGELWFAQDNDDRMDVLPEKKRYEGGDTAKLQVRSPFREATALVAVEREGLMDLRVLTLSGKDPTVELKIDKAWGPNVYVSVLALRGRLREVPWYSLFTWGWKEPLYWARSFWHAGREYRAPTAMVDLSRPAFKFGVAALQVGTAAHALQVSVSTDATQYQVRQKVMARVKVSQGGQPAAGAQVAFAAVDEGLLALRGNDSWDLLGQMIQPRGWGVQTSTAQSEIVGRRHYGRKAVAAGGGGGRGGTRELFDTLLLWRPVVTLDAKGEALVEVPLNDSLTSFRLVAVADVSNAADGARFGSGSTSIRVTQDLQLLSGLPPLVREGDRFQALLTLRNTTTRAMTLRATLQGTAEGDAGVPAPLALPAQDLTLAAGAAQEVSWPVDVPTGSSRIVWEAAVQEQGAAKAQDRVKLTQAVAAAVPLRVWQARLTQLDRPLSLPVAAPADALGTPGGPARGGLQLTLQPRLGGALPGLRRYFETYPYSCLEQKVSKAIALHDAVLWQTTADTLPAYLDHDGLAAYFPPRADDAPRGSDRLTAHVLAAAHEAGVALPAGARDTMLDGLAAFVEGRIERRFWSPRKDIDVRKLAAMAALARHGRFQARWLGSIDLAPNAWPSAALIDWLTILKRMATVPAREQRLAEVQQVLRSRLSYAGTTLRFSTEAEDDWWWLMDNADANAARLLLAVQDDAAWRDDVPRLVAGSLARQQRGAWSTTTANLWGVLALDKFSARFEAVKVAGNTRATVGPAQATLDWAKQPEGGPLRLAWPAAADTLAVTHDGAGQPWLTVQSLAAVPLKAPLRAGYGLARQVEAVQRKHPDRWSRGDVLRVRIEIDAAADMTWVVLADPVPGGATVLGSGLGRDSALATRGESKDTTVSATFEERSFEAWRAYFDHLPRGRHVLSYTLRLNNPGRFGLPPTRIEAMYAPETFGELPNATLEVAP